ncbi:MAG: biotin/lipoyl-binding protein [Acidobacteria bacterium]|nr:biotin/lipoyl-binding protein [Acidobacteriota bacterium]
MAVSGWFRPVTAIAAVAQLACATMMAGCLPRTESLASSQRDYRAASQTFTTEMLLGGTLQPARSAVLYPERAGLVTEVFVARGDLVKAGDVIFSVRSTAADSEREQAQLGLRQAELMLERARTALSKEPLDHARRNHARQQALLAEGLVPTSAVGTAEHDAQLAERAYRLASVDVEVAEASLRRARALADAAERTAASFRVRSPLSGLVVQLNVKTGTPVSPDDGNGESGPAPAEVAVDRGLVFRAAASAGQAQRLQVGQQAIISVPGTHASYTGHVSQIPRVGEKGENGAVTFGVEILLPDASLHDVLLNAPAAATIASAVRVAVAVPSQCIEFDAIGNAFVTVAGTAPQRRKITAGRTGDNWLEVVDGLSEGEFVSACTPE